MEERHSVTQKNRGETSQGKLHHRGPCGPTGVQRMKKDTGQALVGLENVLRESFLPRILFGKSKTLPPIIGYLSIFMVNKYGLGLQNIVI